MRALLVYPTHQNCAEVQAEAISLGLDAAVYPGRTTGGHGPTEVGEIGEDDVEPNCWNTNADDAEAIGFPVVKAICPTCPQRRKCQQEGYLAALTEVQRADLALCTHKRLEYSGFADLSSGRPYVSVHENPIDLLRPQCGSSVSDLVLIQSLLRRLLDDPRCLDWFGNAVRVDDEGHEYESEEVARRRDRLYDFCLRLADVIDGLLAAIERAEKLTEWSIPSPMARPPGIERLLFFASRRMSLAFTGQPWRFVLSAAAGDLMSAAILVRAGRKTADVEMELPIKSAIGFRSNPPAASCTVWFNDATVSAAALEAVVHRTVWNQTPTGRLELQKKAVQIPRDVTRKRSHRIFANLLRGVLADRPQFRQIGLITHRTCLPALKELGQEFQDRIVKTTYFHSGEDRSSNAWHQECDLIVIAGTPRVPAESLVEYLIQIGRIDAAAREPVWGPLRWSGKTESGEPVQITGRGYYDDDWRLAHRDLVRAALIQAIGRGRGLLESGCEVVVMSTEECGLPISDGTAKPFSAKARKLHELLREISAVNSIKGSIEKSAVSTARLANEADLSVRQARELLRNLELRCLVRRVGDRGGWLPVEASVEENPHAA